MNETNDKYDNRKKSHFLHESSKESALAFKRIRVVTSDLNTLRFPRTLLKPNPNFLNLKIITVHYCNGNSVYVHYSNFSWTQIFLLEFLGARLSEF